MCSLPGHAGREIEIDTTRPETILGDTAVAVHPQDAKYSDLIGRYLRHPFNNNNIPIVADSSVKIDFGTG